VLLLDLQLWSREAGSAYVGMLPETYSMSNQVRDYRLFSLANIEQAEITESSFQRRKSFSLRAFAERSFGAFQEEPFDVVWRFSARAAADARQFLFHPTQTFEDQPDGSLIVRFRAGGALEMCWHLFTWGEDVEILKPQRLRTMMRARLEATAL
jgi:predicted DNA-binding transcriptional regulator YafY